jgi:hypothetical protein
VRTSTDGGFRVGSCREEVTLDVRSLPLGYQPARAANGGTRDIPLVMTGSFDIELALLPDDLGDVPPVELTDVRLFVTDDRGTEYYGRIRADGKAAFQDLPPGAYTIHVVTDHMSQSLALRDQPPRVVIAAGRASVSTVRLRLAPPPLRIWKQDEGKGGGKLDGPAGDTR